MSAAERPTSWPSSTHRLRLGEVLVDLRFRLICSAGSETELPQRFFDLWLLLLAEPERVHSRGELLERVWAGVVVEDANLSQAVWTLRKALGREYRHWIRTVAKSGYAFQPGVPIEFLADDSVVPTSAEPTMTVPKPAVAAPIAAQPAGSVGPPLCADSARNFPSRWLLAAAAALLLALIVWQGRSSQAPSAQIISVLEISDSGADPATRWPATLTRSWCDWQLSMLPQLTVLQRDQLAVAADDRASLRTVLVSSGVIPGGANRLYVQAHVQLEGETWQRRVEGDAQQLAAGVDRLCAELLQRLAPQYAPSNWPALQADGAAAAYADFVTARDGRHWSEGARLGRALVTQAPRFGLLRLQLAQVLSTLGQLHEARLHADAALRLLSPLPDPAQQVLAAQLAAVRRDPQAAFSLYAALVQRFPQQPRFVLELARAQLGTERADDALLTLSAQPWSEHDWASQPTALRLTALLVRANGRLQQGDGEAAQEDAKAALRLARQANWPLEQGMAELVLASAVGVQQRGDGDAAGYLRAAAHFVDAGDTLRAQDARLRALAQSVGDEQDIARQLDTLLAQARSAGLRGLEIDALRVVAFRELRAGHPAGYRDKLLQAAEVAEDVGDSLALSRMDLYLLPLEIDGGDYASADARLERLANLPLQGETAFWSRQFALSLAWRRGRYDLVEQGLQLDGPAHTALAVDASLRALLRCHAGHLQLRRGDLGGARNHFNACAEDAAPVFRLAAALGLARVDLYAGDQASATGQLDTIATQLQSIASLSDQLSLRLDFADLAARAGLTKLAQEQLDGLLPLFHGNGQRVLEADVRVALVRLAVAAGDWNTALAQADAVRALAPASDWQLAAALELFDALLAQQRGEVESASLALSQLERRARELGDDVVQVEVHALVAALALDAICCSAEQGRTLLARSGLRGVRWWLPPMSPLAPAAVADSRR